MEKKSHKTKLSTREFEELKELFLSFDQDGSGTICEKELYVVLKCLNMEADSLAVKRMFREVDKDGSGLIEFNEFIEAFSTPSKDALMDAFKKIDRNGDGVLSHSEVKRAMKQAGQPFSDKAIAEMIELADANKDGMVNYEEFLVMLKS